MPGELHVKPCNQLGGRACALTVESIGIEFKGTEVVIDMPDTITARFYDTPYQRWTFVTHPHGRQPGFFNQFAAPTDFRSQRLTVRLRILTFIAELKPKNGEGGGCNCWSPN